MREFPSACAGVQRSETIPKIAKRVAAREVKFKLFKAKQQRRQQAERHMQSSKPQIKLALTIALVALVTACATPTATVPNRDADIPCPEWTSGQLGLAVSVAPIAVPHALTVSEGAVPAYGIQARRISIAVKPPQEASGVRLSANTLSIYIFGGIFRGWATPDGQFADASIDSKAALSKSQSRVVSSTQALEVLPGRVSVTPFLSGQRLHAQTQAIDIAILPGGMPVDQPVVMTSSFWNKDGRPIAPAQLDITLSPLRLSSIYRTVEAKISLDYEISRARGSERFSCTATRREVLVDRDAIRPALWDIGVPTQFGARKQWLALYSPATGAIRAVFTTPEVANAFTRWAQQAGAVTAGGYRLGLFTPADRNEEEPVLPADASIMETFHPVSAEDLAHLRVGEIDKP
jgi:hypothetical protein